MNECPQPPLGPVARRRPSPVVRQMSQGFLYLRLNDGGPGVRLAVFIGTRQRRYRHSSPSELAPHKCQYLQAPSVRSSGCIFLPFLGIANPPPPTPSI